MKKHALTQKVLVLGVDGLDPSLTKKFMDQGKLPNFQKYVNRGAQREDLVLLGGVPTITPPMWTTLATGATPATHGITCFWNQDPAHLDTMVYALDSKNCKAEQLWNVTAESGLKTLVWHWPGSSWPPTSDNPNLNVVEGTQPGAVNMGVGAIDWEKIIIADASFDKVSFLPKSQNNTGAGCIITDMEGAQEIDSNNVDMQDIHTTNIMLTLNDGEMSTTETLTFDVSNSPIKPAEGWAQAPAGAKEFTVVTSTGYARRPALILQNAQGIYDQVAIYKSKKELEPIVTLAKDVFTTNIIDDIMLGEEHRPANRNMRVMELAEDGSHVKLFLSAAMDLTCDALFSPKTLYQQVTENVGYVQPVAMVGGSSPELIQKVILPSWENYSAWQGDSLNYLIQANEYRVVFSHLHNVDCLGHLFWRLGKARADAQNDEAAYQSYMESVYVDTDRYVGRFLHLLDEGWTIFITSDHGLVCTEDEYPALFGDPFGVNATILAELGYTVLKKDAAGQPLKEIDWSQTRAVATRGNHIWINLKGRDATGIVDPADQYELERNIINDLYGYRNTNGKRIVTIVIRNKEAALLGLNGPSCGDLLYWVEEGQNRIHGDCLPTTRGYFDTSVSPIFIAAGQGLKKGYTTDRVIRQVDFAATVAELLGTRMPAQCEGAPAYQIIDYDAE